MPHPHLAGPGRFETLADDAQRFHLRQSSLTERTLLGYTLTCLALASCLLVLGADLAFEPRASWLGFLIMPAGALWLLRYNGEVIADRQRRLVHIRVRTLGFREHAHTVAFDAITALVATGSGRVGDVTLETATGPVPVAIGVNAAAAKRLADRLARAAERPSRLEGTWTARGEPAADDPQVPAPVVSGERAAGATYTEEPFSDGFRVSYPTRSYGTAAVLFICSTTFAAVATIFLGWALMVLWHSPTTFSRVMLAVTPAALLALNTILFYFGVCLSIGHEIVTCADGKLTARTLLAGRPAGYLEIDLSEIKEVRQTVGIKLLWEGGARHLAATLPPEDQAALCAKIRTFWEEKRPAPEIW